MKTPFTALISVVFLIAAMAALYKASDVNPPAPLQGVQCEAGMPERTTPLYITPHFQNLALDLPSYRERLDAVMQDLEPERTGKVQLGYTMIIFPYSMFGKLNDEWVLNTKPLKKQLARAAKFNYPFVTYVFNNHFLPLDLIPVAQELVSDKNNLMHYRDGHTPNESYFQTGLAPLRLTTDENLRMVQMRNQALDAIAQTLKEFETEHPGLHLGSMLNGETHYLYNDFFSGTANFDTPQLTDYHPDEIRDFVAHLKDTPLEERAARIADIPFSEYEWGTVPVTGWVHPLGKDDSIEVWVNNKHHNNAETHINRIDVFRVKHEQNPSFNEPNTGFTEWLDFSTLPAGKHYMEVLLNRNGKRYIIGSRWLNVKTPEGEAGKDNFLINPPARDALPSDVQAYVDLPKEEVTLRYDMLAEAWVHFRADRITNYVETMAQPFLKHGFTTDKLFSYQLTPWLLGNWNPILFGIDKTFFASEVVSPGITLYGGNMNSPHAEKLVEGRHYGVPELHPQANMSPDWLAESLRRHYCKGATFVSPYFFKIEETKKNTEHDRMAISRENKQWGSDIFYDALKTFLSY